MRVHFKNNLKPKDKIIEEEKNYKKKKKKIQQLKITTKTKK